MQSHRGSLSNAELTHDRPRNVVVFGECGVGKSSLINLLAGQRICETSSGALGCTLDYQRHELQLENHTFAVWDTAGLDEGSQGSVPAEKAEAYLRKLLHDLSENDGVDLLLYCVRGTRVRSALLMNYHIFYSAICRKKVPIAIVITGLENQEGNMETWWITNEKQFSLLKMRFDSHACVTTLSESPCIDRSLLEERREVSKRSVTKMIISTCRTQQWRPPERSWIDSAYSDIRSMLFPRDGLVTRLPNVIMCEASRDSSMRLARKRSISFQSPLAFSPQVSIRSPFSISNDLYKLPLEEGRKCTPERVYRVYQVPRKQTSESLGEDTKKVAVKRGADLLILCIRMDDKLESGTVKSRWEHFSFTYGGELSPQIVVVVGALNQDSAENWWKREVGETLTRNDVVVAYLPTAGDDDIDAARTHLQRLIDDHCIDCNMKEMPSRSENLFKRPLLLDMSSLAILRPRPENGSKEDRQLPSPEQDILTKRRVWYLAPETATPNSP